jgi:hypothetical protein
MWVFCLLKSAFTLKSVMENKKSFIAYVDWGETFDALPDEKAGQLVKHLFAYVNDKNPVTDDILINAVFTNIKLQLKRDLTKWKNISTQRAEIGKIGGIKSGEKRSKRSKCLKNEANASKRKQNEHDTVNDTVNVKEEYLKKANKSPDFIDDILDCFIQEHGSYEVMSRGKERTAISTILKKYKEKYPAATSEETLIGLRAYFKQCINISDIWLMNNMSPSIIVSKFNEINKILRNGTNKKSSGASEEAVARIIAEKFGSDSDKRR